MLFKRIIPCLDIKNGRTVKGVNFVNLRDAGDPVALAAQYAMEGADELVFLDISATQERRSTMLKWVEQVAREINIPFTVGGGVSSVEGAYAILRAGADKVAVNSAAISSPELLSELRDQFGSQCVVLAVDGAKEEGRWEVYRGGGRERTGLELFSWVKKGVALGAGEVLFTSMDHDGTGDGFAIEALRQLSKEVNVPIIASGGAGNMEHFKEVLEEEVADAALAASVFHFGEIRLPDLKTYLETEKIRVRQ